MIHKFYEWFHSLVSKPDERREYSSGYWPDKIRNYVVRMCRASEGKLLEFGCGEGLFLINLKKVNPAIHVWGVDKWDEILERAKTLLEKEKVKDIRLISIKDDRLVFEDAFFDTVVCINVFYNMSSLHKVEIAAREMVRVLKSGGYLIAEFKNRLNPFVFLKYKCARYYDATIKKQNLPLTTFTIKEMARLFQTLGCPIKKNIFLGFPHNRFAPIVIFEAVKK